jgi:enoyl-CoA hydratase/carnithine racemase
MDSEKVRVVQVGNLAVVYINNPPVNTLESATVRQLEETIAGFESSRLPKVIVLTGQGKTFSAGAELSEIAHVNVASDAEGIARNVKRLLHRIETFKKPIIAAISGPCFGGGMEIALACHIRIADETARFGLPEIKLALMPGGGGTQRLPRLVGFPKSAEMILTGESIDAQEAYRIGLINSVTAAGMSLDAAKAIAERIGVKSQMAISSVLEAMRATIYTNALEGMEIETHLFGKLFETDDKREGVAAFQEKRRPQFLDR